MNYIKKRIWIYAASLSALSFCFLTAPVFIPVLSSPAFAANECGAAVAGDTVICNGDGTPATDNGTYSTISYTVPITLNVDGTVNPLSLTGPIVIVSNAGPQTYNITGNVSIVRSGAIGLFTVGDYNFHARDQTINVGEDVSIDITRTTANGNVYGISAGASNGAVSINTAADVIVRHTGGGNGSFLTGVVANATSGGANSSASLVNSGNVSIEMTAGYYAYILYSGSSGLGSSSLVTLENSGNLSMVQNTGNAGCIGLVAANTGSGGAFINHTGTVNISGDCAAGAYGVNLGAVQGDATANIDGTIDVSSNAASAVGIYADASASTTVLNINSDVSATSDDAIGIYLYSTNLAHDINIADNANVTATGAGSVGIYVSSINGGTIDIGQNATVSSSDAVDGGAIYASNSTDIITSYGDITGHIYARLGNDTVNMLGGSLNGNIDMGDGDDALNIRDIDTAGIANIGHLDGGAGSDTLTFTNIQHGGSSMAVDDLSNGINLGNGWETINFNNTLWTLTGNLTLGGSTVNVNNGTTLFAGNGVNSVISSVIPNDPATLNNAGIIDFTNGTYSANDTLTIFGNYVGNNGTIIVDAVAGPGGQAGDKIIIDGSNGGGSATGSTFIALSSANLGGSTSGNGILVVETINGATAAANAFSLAPGSTSSGAYKYDLVNVSSNFYLSALLRNEVPTDLALQGLTHRYGMSMLGTMDQRTPFENNGIMHDYAVWGRGFAETSSIGNDGDFARNGPAYDYDMSGAQIGLDLYREETSKERGSHLTGIYVGVAGIDSTVEQDASSARAGTARMTGYSLGAYWSYFGPNSRWYTDAVLQGSYYGDIETMSIDGEGIETEGLGLLGSFEAGIKMALKNNIDVTPQIQLVYQTTDINGAGNAAGNVEFDRSDAISVRIGPRIAKTWTGSEKKIEAWISPNLWHSFADESSVRFTNTAGTAGSNFNTDVGSSWAQFGFGIAADLGNHFSLFTSGDYSRSIDKDGYALAGRIGIKKTW